MDFISWWRFRVLLLGGSHFMVTYLVLFASLTSLQGIQVVAWMNVTVFACPSARSHPTVSCQKTKSVTFVGRRLGLQRTSYWQWFTDYTFTQIKVQTIFFLTFKNKHECCVELFDPCGSMSNWLPSFIEVQQVFRNSLMGTVVKTRSVNCT
jgi:hypothetical protein